MEYLETYSTGGESDTVHNESIISMCVSFQHQLKHISQALNVLRLAFFS